MYLHKTRLFVTTHTDGEANVIGDSNCEDKANLDDEDGKEKGRKEFTYNIDVCSMSVATELHINMDIILDETCLICNHR